MANLTCLNLLKVCHLRVLRLDDDGSVVAAADARYEHKAPILMGYTPTTPDRERFEQLDGCGDQCALYIGPPKAVDSAELTLNLCQLDAELIELLAGGSLIEDTDDTIGYLAPTDATVNQWGVGVETWSIAWNGRQRALRNGAPAWYRHFFPKTSWVVGETTKSNDGFTPIQLTGSAEVNSGFGTGWTFDPLPVPVGEAVYGWFVDDEVPDGECGYQDTETS